MPSIELPQGTVHYRDEGRGEPLVLVHGLLVDNRVWDKVVPLLSSRFRVIAPTMPFGCHRTPMKPDADLTTAGIAKLIDDFAAALDLDGYTLIGNDTGGAWAHVSATRHPGRVGRLVINSSDLEKNFLPPMFKPLEVLAPLPGSQWLIGQVLGVRAMQRTPWAQGWLSHTPIDPEVTASSAEGLRTDPALRCDCRKLLRGFDNRLTVQAAKDLATFARPTLWAWGADDKFFPIEQARRIAATMPDARFEVIEGSRTYTPIDQPERLAELVTDFVAGRNDEGPAAAGPSESIAGRTG